MLEHASHGSNRRLAACPGSAGRAFGSRRALALAMFLVLPAAAQSPGVPPSGPSASRFGQVPQPETDTGMDARIEARRITQLNVLRQKSIVSDTEKLLRLARELDNDAKGDTPTLTPAERMRKATEIEHLAKEVREKMTFTVGDPPEQTPPFTIYSR